MSGIDDLIAEADREATFYYRQAMANRKGSVEREQAYIMYSKYALQWQGLVAIKEEMEFAHGNRTSESDQEPS